MSIICNSKQKSNNNFFDMNLFSSGFCSFMKALLVTNTDPDTSKERHYQSVSEAR